MRITFLLIGLLGIINMSNAALQLAEQGKPQAEILFAADAPPAVWYAAEELQTHVQMISGAKLPLVHRKGTLPGQVRLLLKPEEQTFQDDLQRIGDSDGYGVKRQGSELTIFANRPKGILNGVYRLLYRNTDIIWARPKPEFGTIYSENPNLTLSETEWLDVPVYQLRGWQMTGNRRFAFNSNVWQFRQGCNWAASYMNADAESAKYGTITEYGGGHNLTGRYITGEKYFDKHPDFFPFYKGERQDPRRVGRVQLCFTNEKMTTAFIDEVDARMQAEPGYDTCRIMIEDLWPCCECAECRKDIQLPDGTSVSFDEPDFRSTQFFLWLNKIARHFQKDYPEKRILTFGYFFTEIPPRIQVEPNISISFCPISKNSKRAIDQVSNEATLQRFQDWIKMKSILTWREYYGLTEDFPRPIDVVAAADWRFVHTNGGVVRTYSEMRGDYGDEDHLNRRIWDVNALYFWTMTQASWNPYQDITALRREFLRRVYKEAADDVEEFYALTEKGFFAAPGNSRYNDSAVGHWRLAVVEAGIVDDCRAALERAAKKNLTGNRAKMLAALRNTFEKNVQVAATEQKFRLARAKRPPVFDTSFSSLDWAAAEIIENFYADKNKKEPAPYHSEVRVLYDNENIYVGLKCDFPEPEKMEYSRTKYSTNTFPPGEGFELFFASGNQEYPYYQFAVDPAANRFAFQESSFAWDVDTKLTATGWSAMATVPWSTLGLEPGKLDVLRASFIRLSKLPEEKRRYYRMFDYSGHSVSNFAPFVLEK